MHRTDDQSAGLPPFLCELSIDAERAIVIPHGGLDAASFPRLEAVVVRLCAAGFSTVVLDLRAPGSVDRAALGLLHRVDEIAGRSGVTLSLELRRADADCVLEPTALHGETAGAR